ncbi:uncharacterized protein LOC107263223 isoform X2 [Cephus cinctus]|nr:uncharacterized protein LOC107263223 isoform X2 [Cephus cinctus]
MDNLNQYRSYSTEPKPQQNIRLPQLSDFPMLFWPNFFKSIRNFILVHMVIKPYMDNEFNLQEFVAASKHAVSRVSRALAMEEYESLEGLVSDELLADLKSKISNFALRQRTRLAVEKEDIYMCFPYEVGVMFKDEDSKRRFVEITMIYHVMTGIGKMRAEGELIPINIGTMPEYQEKMYILNYRFIREFTSGVQTPWVINMINHFMPIDNLN